MTSEARQGGTPARPRSSNSKRNCHPEGRAVCVPKDLNHHTRHNSTIEILPRSSRIPQDDNGDSLHG